MEVPTPAHPEDFEVLHASFTDPDPTTFLGLDALGIEALGQRREFDRAVLAYRVAHDAEAAVADRWCRRCGYEGRPRGSITRRLAHVPFGARPTTLQVSLVRFVCCGCGRVWRLDTTAAAEPQAKLTRGALRWALGALVVQHLIVVRVTEVIRVAGGR